MVSTGRRSRTAAWALLLVAVSAALGVCVTGFVLADRYRPSTPWAPDVAGPDTRQLVDVNEAMIGVLSGLALLVALGAVVPRIRTTVGLTPWSTVAALVALAATFATGATRAAVQYDQVALWAVSVGTDLRGYWLATDDPARFVIVDGLEVPRSEYTATLLVHLVAPLVTLAALGVIGWDLRRRSGRGADG